MGGVFGGLCPTGKTAHLAAADGVAHAAAQANGVNTHDIAFTATDVARHDFSVVVHPLQEIVCAQINPGAATHALVHTHFGHASGMVDLINHVLCTVVEGLVGHIYGITAGFRDVGYPLHQGDVFILLRWLHRLDLSAATFAEWTFIAYIDFLLMGESSQGTVFPFLFVQGNLKVFDVFVVVAVHNFFVRQPKAVAGGIDNGAGILQHRDDVGNHDGLRQKVLCGAEKPWTLPNPPAFLWIVVAAVALAQAQMPAIKTFADRVGTGEVLHPRLIVITFLP